MKHRSLAVLSALAMLAALIPATALAADSSPDDLIISEYVEGSSLNKALELYNGTGAPVDLADYTIEVYFNGSESAGTTINLAGVLDAGATYVVADDGADPAILAVADQTTTSNLWNGNDAIVLAGPAGVVDAFGQVGVDPGSQWQSEEIGTADATLRRMANVCAGDTNPGDAFDPADEWDGFAQDTFDGLGSHAVDCGDGEVTAPLLTELVVTPTGGEFIEIHNPGTEPVDLSDIYVTDATFAGGDTFYYNIVTGSNAGGGGFADFHARFPDGATITGGEYQTIAVAGSDDYVAEYGTDPDYELFEDGSASDDIPDMREALPGSINDQGGLTNSGEVVVLYQWDGASDLVTDLDYALWGDKDEAVDKTGVSIDGPDADGDATEYAPDTAINDQDVIATGAHDGGESFQRIDLTEGTEATSGGNGFGGADETSENLSATWAINSPTPGAASEQPDPEPEPLELDINEVQGPGDVSPVEGELVTVEGVVVGDYQGDDEDQLGGFNLQEETADQDGDPATSEGIFVFAPFAEDVVVGDVVSVTGTVDEFFGMTQITDVTDVTVNDPAPDEVTAVDVSLPVADRGDFEPYEGMLVTFPQDLYISEFFNFDRFGEIVLTTDRQYQGTHVAEPGPAANAVAEANALARITLDDTRDVENPETVLHPDGQLFTLDHTFRGGDILQDTTGTMHFGFGSYRIQPVYLNQVEGVDGPVVTYINENPRPTSPDPIGGDVRVASFNVLNFFTHLDDGVNDICGPTGNLECRGADDAGEYQRQLDKLIAGILALDADIVGIQEIENDIRGETDDGDRAHHPVLTLVEELNAAEGAEIWAWGGEANHYNDYPVRNEIIYRTDAVEPVGDPVALADEAFDLVRPGDIAPVGRPPLAQTFRQNVDRGSGQPFAVVVNHFKSKGSSCADIGDPGTGDGQGNCNLTRVAQSEALLDFVDELSEDSSGVLVVGDLNSYAMEDPITTLENGGLTDLVEEFIGADAYSFVFDGQLGYLDTALATRSMLNWVTGTTIFNINADEPDILDYDTSFKSDTQAALYEPEAYRVSDHDPVIVGLTFGGPGDSGRSRAPR